MKKLLLSLLAVLLIINTSVCTVVHADDKEEVVIIDVSDKLLQEGALFSERGKEESLPKKAATRGLTIYEVLANALRNRETMVDVSSFGIPTSNASRIYTDTLNNNPDIYYAGNNIGYGTNSNGTITGFYLFYKDFTAEQMAAFDAKVDEILTNVGSDWSTLKKIFYIHDWIVLNTVYDINSTNQYSAYGVIIDGKAVCQGYSLAFKLLLNRLGIDCKVVTSSSINHAWNYIEFDGDHYYIDVTWDDPVGAIEDNCEHDNMLRSKAGIIVTGHSGSDWLMDGINSYNASSNDRFEDALWQSYDKTIYFLDNYGIFVDDNNYVNIYDMENETPIKTYKCVNDYWRVLNQSAYWNGKYYTTVLNNDRIYYNTSATIYEINLATDRIKEIYQLTNNEKALGYIYGLNRNNNLLNYEIAEGPNDETYKLVDSFDLNTLKHNIIYHLDGGTNAISNINYYYEGDEFEFAEPTLDGYTFIGWYSDIELNNPITGITYTDNEDIDVYAKWEEIDTGEMISNKKQQGTLLSNGTFELELSVNIDNNVDLDTAYVLVNDEKILLCDLPVKDEKLVVTTPAIAPKRLNDNCIVRYYDGDDNPISNEYELSVVSYINTLIETSTSEANKAFYKSLLNYAAYAQLYFEYETDNLANASLSESDKAVNSVNHEDVSEYAMSQSGSTEGIVPYGQSLILDDETSYRVYFQLTGSYPIEEYIFKNGEDVLTPRFYEDDIYYVFISRLAAPDLDKINTITVELDDFTPIQEFGEVGQGVDTGDLTVNTSVLTYVELMLRKTPTTESETKLANMTKALYKYCIYSKDIVS